jgi:hypothetical protein
VRVRDKGIKNYKRREREEKGRKTIERDEGRKVKRKI